MTVLLATSEWLCIFIQEFSPGLLGFGLVREFESQFFGTSDSPDSHFPFSFFGYSSCRPRDLLKEIENHCKIMKCDKNWNHYCPSFEN